MQLLSVDLASKDPRDLGLALLQAAGTTATIKVELVPPMHLRLTRPLEPAGLAEAIVELAEAHDCRWIAVDGPSAWKHPDNGLVHSRVSERELNAPAKVGLPGQVKPRSYTAFVEFSVAVFDVLSSCGYSRLRGPATQPTEKTSVEILPVACWPRLGSTKLPAKAKCKAPALAACTETLAPLVAFQSTPGHDELQATVGGLAVMWQILGKTDWVHWAGCAPVLLDSSWREGFILAPSRNHDT